MPTCRAVTLPLVAPIVPVLRDQPFDDPAYLFEPKYDGFRGMPERLGAGRGLQDAAPELLELAT